MEKRLAFTVLAVLAVAMIASSFDSSITGQGGTSIRTKEQGLFEYGGEQYRGISPGEDPRPTSKEKDENCIPWDMWNRLENLCYDIWGPGGCGGTLDCLAGYNECKDSLPPPCDPHPYSPKPGPLKPLPDK